MQCPECEHDNTEGAWLCINCGAKLPREDVKEQASEPEGVASSAPPQEPSRFAPQISENLRRLRDQTERERARQRARAARSPRPTASRESSGPVVYFGFSPAVWAIIAFILIVFIFAMSRLQ